MTDVKKICENLGWAVDQANGKITLIRTFAQGAGFGITLKEDVFEEDLRQAVEEFDPEEYATSQVIAKRNGAQGMPGGEQLFKIAHEINGALNELLDAFEEPEDLKIYFGDLNPEAQERLVAFLGGENGNYDVFPIATLEKAQEASEDERTCFYCGSYHDGFCHHGEEDDYACIERDPNDFCDDWTPFYNICSDCRTCMRYKEEECEGGSNPCFYREPVYA